MELKVEIKLIGPPGSGKTQFTRVLQGWFVRQGFIVEVFDEVMYNMRRPARDHKGKVTIRTEQKCL